MFTIMLKVWQQNPIVQKTPVFAMYICLEQQAVTGPAIIKLEKFMPSVGAVFSLIL